MKLIFLLLGFLEFLTQILIFYSLDLSKPKSLTLDISTMHSVRRSNDLVELSKVYTLRLQWYMDKKIWVCGKDSLPLLGNSPTFSRFSYLATTFWFLYIVLV